VVLSKREKYIGLGTIGAVVLLAINSLVVEPYFARLEELDGEKQQAFKKSSDDDKLLIAQKNLQGDWNSMLTNGLEADDSTAASRTQQMIQTFAREANITLESTSPNHAPSQKGPFQTVEYTLDYNTSGNDSMRQVARFISSVESAHTPMRLSSIRVQSTREGTNQLNVKMVVSALYMPPTSTSTGPGLEDLLDMENQQ
jgi:hypothetical protein